MYWNRSSAAITAAWQSEIESKWETGATALLLGGAPDTLLTSATTLLALQQSAIHRNDVATPMLVAGGNSTLWLGLLLPPQPTGHALYAPAPTLVYGGADGATYLATVLLTATHTLTAPGVFRGSTQQDMGGYFAPRLHPGAATAWEQLPLVELGEQPASAFNSRMMLMEADATQETNQDSADDWADDWIAWGVVLLTFCLIFSAFLI